MAGWVGITIAMSLVIIAMCLVGVAFTALMSLKEIRQISEALTVELEGLRRELAESLGMLKRLGEQGQDVLDLAKDEVQRFVKLSGGIRGDIEAGTRRVKRRLADLDAVVEVVQEEVEGTVIDFGASLRDVREGGNVVAQLSRLIRPRRRSRV